MEQPTIFARMGWAERYEGDEDDIPARGGTDRRKDEKLNFKVLGQRVYGYFQPSRDGPGSRRATINLERIVPNCHADSLPEVRVVFIATRPEGGQVVVGWYEKATVYRKRKPRRDQPEPERKGSYKYFLDAEARDAVRLEVPDRTCEIEVTKGGMRTTGIRYPFRADGSRDKLPFEDRARQFIATYEGPNLA